MTWFGFGRKREGARRASRTDEGGTPDGVPAGEEGPVVGLGAAGYRVVPQDDAPDHAAGSGRPRGFDAVAERVLGDPGPGTAPAFLAEPTARINEAVRTGRTAGAAQLAEQTVAQASKALGPEHPEVLRLRELTAYIAYLSDDPVRALRICLGLARAHRRAGDAEAAYGSVHGADTAWRAVRDPEQGLELGRELIGLWAGLAAEGGPAAADAGRLESARARMDRLAERARARRSGAAACSTPST
ncbi:hypothetical protein SUDANB58_03377 [Streptomyces sp. enrichment culture]|uniref:hypothetical protein n=1 Tax=Streptomyces sp. enrichment culture TaxID=1795815 RepID=UPI003F57432E